jgi:hypothetical protein
LMVDVSFFVVVVDCSGVAGITFVLDLEDA